MGNQIFPTILSKSTIPEPSTLAITRSARIGLRVTRTTAKVRTIVSTLRVTQFSLAQQTG